MEHRLRTAKYSPIRKQEFHGPLKRFLVHTLKRHVKGLVRGVINAFPDPMLPARDPVAAKTAVAVVNQNRLVRALRHLDRLRSVRATSWKNRTVSITG